MVKWRDNIAILANEPNVLAKLSGFGTFIHRNDADHIAHLVRDTVAAFGPQRCLWGSNFPIEKLWTDYASLTPPTGAGSKSWAAQMLKRWAVRSFTISKPGLSAVTQGA